MNPDHLARAALTAWSSIADRHHLEVMPRATNPLWRVDVTDGQTFVLKQLPQYPPGVPPVVEFRVLCHLQRAGVPVALPIVTDDGTIHATVEGRRWTLQPFLASQSSNHDLGPNAADTAFSIGTAIGHMNQALATYPWPVESFVDDPVEVLREALPGLPEAASTLHTVVDRLSAACTGLPVQLTHGDCNDGNVLVHDGRVAGFIDVDHLPTGPRVRDLAYYLASRLRAHLAEPETATFATTAMLASLNRYVAGYHTTYPLTEHELDAIVPLMLVVEIGGAHWSLHGWEPDQDRYRRNLNAITWMTSHLDDLTSAVTASTG